jgi:hypothetical protein
MSAQNAPLDAKKWVRQSTCKDVDVEVDLEDFSNAEILQELIDRDLISEAAALQLLKPDGQPEIRKPHFHAADYESAFDRAMRGQKSDALHFLERALGTEWIGALT